MRPARELVSNLLEGGEERLRLTGGRACVTPRDRDDLAADRGSIDDVDLRERAGFELVGDRGLGKERDSEALLDHLLRRVDVVELHACRGRDPRSHEERARKVVVARGPVELDELLVGELLHPDAPLGREPVSWVRHEDEPVLVERGGDDAGVLKGADEADRDLLTQDEIEDLLRVPGAHAHRDARIPLGEALQEGG